MRRTSTNVRSPFLGPKKPIYPQLRQVLQALAPAGPVWSAQVQQGDGSPNYRGREQAYLWEPNGVPLATGGFYRSRLVGSYDGALGPLPLYAVGLLCCARGSSSSGSAFEGLISFSQSASPSPSSSEEAFVLPYGQSPSSSVSPSLSQSLEFSLPSLPTSESPSPSSEIASLSVGSLLSLSVSPSESSSSLSVSASPIGSISECGSGVEFPFPSEEGGESLSASPSPSSSSAGPSSLSSVSPTSQSGIAVPCCPGVYVADPLMATVTNSAGCACLEGDYLIFHLGGLFDEWSMTTAACGQPNFTITLECPPNGSSYTSFNLAIACGAETTSGILISGSCDPFSLTFLCTLSDPTQCCAGSFTVTITFP